MEPQARHQCLIYDGAPSRKLRMMGAIIQSRLEEGYRCLYLNSAPMVASMLSTLSAMGIDVAAEIAATRLVLSSEAVAGNGEFDIEVMMAQLEGSIDQALSDGYKGLWASGDMTWEFGPRQDFSRLVQYELKLEALFGRRKELCGICQYHKDTLPEDVMRQGLLLHRGLVVNETLSLINPHYLKFPAPGDQDAGRHLDETIALLCKDPGE